MSFRASLDSSRTLTFVGGRCAELVGYDPQEFVELHASYAELIHPDDRGNVFAEIESAILQDRDLELSYRLQAPHGGAKWVWERSRIVRDEAGQPRAVRGCVLDLSSLPLVRSQERVEQLASGVAHDLRNLLTVLTGSAQMLARHVAATSPQRRQVARILSVANEAASLASQLLGIARRRPLQFKPVSLNEVVVHATPVLEEIAAPPIELTIELDPALGTTLANFAQLEQVVLNLATNARDAMPEGGLLLVATRNVNVGRDDANRPPGIVSGPYTVLVVADTGIGIPQRLLARVFERHFSTKESLGLGLGTVQQIVSDCGGAVRLESELGTGTTFEVYLPRFTQPGTQRTSWIVPKSRP
jgi:signal transduction histidine kinase